MFLERIYLSYITARHTLNKPDRPSQKKLFNVITIQSNHSLQFVMRSLAHSVIEIIHAGNRSAIRGLQQCRLRKQVCLSTKQPILAIQANRRGRRY